MRVGTAAFRVLAILLFGTPGCSPADDGGLECPAEDERYVPTGPNVDLADECAAGSCPLYCTDEICALEEQRYRAFFCEPCDSLEAFEADGCSGCAKAQRGGGVWYICTEI